MNPFGVGVVIWLGILECAPLKVLGSILSGANFGGQVHTEQKLRTGPPQVGGGIGLVRLVGPWIGYRVFKNQMNYSFSDDLVRLGLHRSVINHLKFEVEAYVILLSVNFLDVIRFSKLLKLLLQTYKQFGVSKVLLTTNHDFLIPIKLNRTRTKDKSEDNPQWGENINDVYRVGELN
ncbi:hypothetical protein MTR_2g067390 [Medicago truncatula]|uniref:Transmembrane protein n=1 Tax=Medicago truncatula TaxID=3880 RepID=A0A072V917_MEDTR|nr:hypothetical protein MTR_2g067390 [Medicago truncatula]